ncbi:hypothetical protein L195_g022546, partial [Trifolium pratense]
DEKSVEHLSTQDLLKRHIKRAKRVRAHALQDTEVGLGFWFLHPPEQFRNDIAAGNLPCCDPKDIRGRFADALLKELAGISIPPERLYGLGTGSAEEASKHARTPVNLTPTAPVLRTCVHIMASSATLCLKTIWKSSLKF